MTPVIETPVREIDDERERRAARARLGEPARASAAGSR